LRERVQERIDAGGLRALALDLGGLAFIDSSGLGLLLDLRRLAVSADLQFSMRNVPDGPARVISIAGLAETFGLTSPGDGTDGS
jgi:anti-anti-sigma factor